MEKSWGEKGRNTNLVTELRQDDEMVSNGRKTLEKEMSWDSPHLHTAYICTYSTTKCTVSAGNLTDRQRRLVFLHLM